MGAVLLGPILPFLFLSHQLNLYLGIEIIICFYLQAVVQLFEYFSLFCKGASIDLSLRPMFSMFLTSIHFSIPQLNSLLQFYNKLGISWSCNLLDTPSTNSIRLLTIFAFCFCLASTTCHWFSVNILELIFSIFMQLWFHDDLQFQKRSRQAGGIPIYFNRKLDITQTREKFKTFLLHVLHLFEKKALPLTSGKTKTLVYE